MVLRGDRGNLRRRSASREGGEVAGENSMSKTSNQKFWRTRKANPGSEVQWEWSCDELDEHA